MALMTYRSSSRNVIARETLSQYSLVYLNTVDSRYYLADSNSFEQVVDCTGIVLQTGGIAEGESGAVQIASGLVNNSSWSWQPGQRLYVGVSGAITTDPSLYKYSKTIGYATTATQISFDPQIGWSNVGDEIEVSGDQLEIDYVPENYTPGIIPETNSIRHLGSHLKGINEKIAIQVGVNYTPEHYTPIASEGISINHVEAHLRGVDVKLDDFVNIKELGAVGDGITDDTLVIQNALDTYDCIYFPSGDYVVTSPLFITKNHQQLRGFKKAPTNLRVHGSETSILCHNIIGYLFNVNIPNMTSSTFWIENFFFDGRSKAGRDIWSSLPDYYSTTWEGIVTNALATEQVANLEIAYCAGGFSFSPTYILDLGTFFWVHIHHSMFFHFDVGGGICWGAYNATTTTMTISKCYFTYLRQGFDLGAFTSAAFYDCVFESSLISGSIFGGIITFIGCHWEHLKFDMGTGLTTGLSDRDFGVGWGEDVLPGQITSVINLMYTQATFISCTFGYQSEPLATAWFFCVGRGCQYGSGGSLTLDGCYINASAGERVFEEDPQAYSYTFYTSITSAQYPFSGRAIAISDIRMFSDGYALVQFPSSGGLPVNRQECFIKRGKLILYYPSFNVPTLSPVDGTWVLGDTIYVNPVAGGYIGYVCTVSGTPGTWKGFGAISV